MTSFLYVVIAGGSSLLSETDMRPAFGGTTGSLGTGGLAGPIGYGASLQQCDSILSLVELRRPGNRGRLDFASLQAARLAKSRRVSLIACFLFLFKIRYA